MVVVEMVETEERKTFNQRAEVVPVVLEPHPDADNLSLVQVYNYTVVVGTNDWQGLDRGVYITPDSVVSDMPQFEFLGEHKRIKVRRFRGVYSQGLLMPAPAGANIGDDLSEAWNITRWEPKEQVTMYGSAVPQPKVSSGFIPKYDVENWFRYAPFFNEQEDVVVTEKIHGANARFLFSSDEDKMFCGSKAQWKSDVIGSGGEQDGKEDLWWKCMRRNLWIEEFCRAFPDYILYGEVFGNVQKLKYGAGKNDVFFRAFDVWSNTEMRFLNWDELTNIRWNGGLETIVNPERWVPVIYCGGYDLDLIKGMSDGQSMIPNANHIREGIVLFPTEERHYKEIGRLKLKIVSNKYLEKN